jgi:hypothetical protein
VPFTGGRLRPVRWPRPAAGRRSSLCCGTRIEEPRGRRDCPSRLLTIEGLGGQWRAWVPGGRLGRAKCDRGNRGPTHERDQCVFNTCLRPPPRRGLWLIHGTLRRVVAVPSAAITRLTATTPCYSATRLHARGLRGIVARLRAIRRVIDSATKTAPVPASRISERLSRTSAGFQFGLRYEPG